jgi:hypothetical protein
MILLFLMGCPVAMANDYPDTYNKCVIDRCENQVCTIETPEGWVEVNKKHDYYEGKEVTCPMWLIEPT